MATISQFDSLSDGRDRDSRSSRSLDNASSPWSVFPWSLLILPTARRDREPGFLRAYFYRLEFMQLELDNRHTGYAPWMTIFSVKSLG